MTADQSLKLHFLFHEKGEGNYGQLRWLGATPFTKLKVDNKKVTLFTSLVAKRPNIHVHIVKLVFYWNQDEKRYEVEFETLSSIFSISTNGEISKNSKDNHEKTHRDSGTGTGT